MQFYTDIDIYTSVKEKLGFRYWWIDQRDSHTEIVLDDKSLDSYVQGKNLCGLPCISCDIDIRFSVHLLFRASLRLCIHFFRNTCYDPWIKTVFFLKQKKYPVTIILLQPRWFNSLQGSVIFLRHLFRSLLYSYSLYNECIFLPISCSMNEPCIYT